MSWLAKIESACAALIERSFAKTFPSDLEPAQIARRLVATMEAKTRTEGGRLVAPPRYVVFVASDDFARLSEHRVYLEREWASLLREMADGVGVAILGSGARVALRERADLPSGAMHIEADGIDPTITIDAPKDLTAATDRRYNLRMIEGVPEYGIYRIAGTTRVGRQEESEIFLVDPSVSRNHAIIDLVDGELFLRDCDSTNGTFLNDERITTTILREGDTVTFGKTKLRLEVDRR